ncbi:MAG: methyltransferase [Tannerellaceae bacterium]|jgi:tRNA1Val (adenine37-N6)-methyltransferase|nr:methyltransferase [Tannerellaceae bacterium]
MANPFFKFKQFTVFHDKCAMKVGTDGVLLGAWTNTADAANLLDAGTGTGLIALMLAQRTNAAIDAIDIDEGACRQAAENVAGSPFSGRIRIIHSSFVGFQPGRKYDLIVSNPPYFSQSLKSPDDKRSQARHDDSLPLPDLIAGSKEMLSENGRIALILPVEQEGKLDGLLTQYGLHRIRQTNVMPVVNGQIKRILIELSATPNPHCAPDCLAIERERHKYTKEYEALTRDFYLNM